MAVSNYTPNPCKYRIDQLDNVVYVVNKESIGGIKVADGEAYIDGIGYYNAVDCLNVSLTESESLDERYEFLHTVNFSVNGYLHWTELNDYYIMLRDKNNTYWLVNPYFKIQYTYTYVLDGEGNHTDYVVSTKSNYPMLRVNNFNAENVKPCNTYDYCGIDIMAINETAYSKYVESFNAETQQYVGRVKYTNDGFKVVKYLGNTCIFTEAFDGKKISHTVKFNINFDNYKSSWHYNLLEFADNKYAVVLSTKCGMKVATGFGYGLQPSYSVTADDDQSINHIEITLSDLHDTGNLLKLPYELPFEHDSATTWNNVDGEYACIDSTTAVYTLRQKFDIFGNPKDEYMCLEGFEDRYTGYNIVGTFSDEQQFYCPQCRAEECTLQTSLPSNITFYNTECKTFTIRSNSDFTISSNSNYITVSPTSGAANTLYTVAVCNSKTPSSTANLYNLTVTYCSGLTKGYTVTVVNEPVTDCLPQGSEYSISVYAQDVTIPTNCCIQSVSASCCISNIQIQNGYVKFRVDANDTGSERTITLIFTKCDNTTVTATITQAHYYSRWVYEGSQCNGEEWCALDRMYSGETSDNINTPTYVTRYRDCIASSACTTPIYKWENMDATTDFYCNDCPVQYKWENMNPATDYYCNNCEIVPQYRWINLDPTVNYYCSGTTKYYKQQQQISTDNGTTWENVSPAQYRMGESAQTQSSDCGYIPTIQYKWENMNPSTDYYCVDCPPALYEWRRITPVSGDDSTFVCDTCCVSQYRWVDLDPAVDYYCSGTTKYYKQQRQTSIDCGESWDWVSPAEYQWGASAQAQSTDCGYVPPIPTGGTKFSATYSGGRTYSAACDGNTTLTSGNTQPSTISRSAMTTAEIGDCVTSIGDSAFYKCTGLSSVTIGSGVTSIERYAFYNCNRLTSVVIPSGVTSIGDHAFQDCSGLTSINIPDSVTSIGSSAFSRCHSTTVCSIGSGVTNIGTGAFYWCNSLTSIDIPDSVTSIGGNAFGSCVSLTSVTIPDSVTSIGEIAFYNTPWWGSYSADTSNRYGNIIYINDVAYQAVSTSITSCSFKSSTVSVGGGAFEDCSSLTSIDIPDSVTSIGNYAFQYCGRLTSCTIGSGVTSIGDSAFLYCTRLQSIICLATTPPTLGLGVFNATNNCPIYVPSGSVDAYKAANGWSTYADRIQPIT